MTERVTTRVIRESKGVRRLACLTAYDVTFARLFDRAGLDLLLVGDSAAGPILGYSSTLPVTLEEIGMLATAVSRGVERAMVVVDMPFLSYQVSTAEALRNAGCLLKETGVQAVKLEGAGRVVETIRALTGAGIPVLAHLGFTPQSEHQYGGRRVLEGRTAERARQLLTDARAVEDAGAFALVLEKIPWQVAQRITETVRIPTIGIGAGPHCDGQILIMHDLLGLGEPLRARFCPPYADLNSVAEEALQRYVSDVADGRFPTLEQSYTMRPEEMERLAGDVREE